MKKYRLDAKAKPMKKMINHKIFHIRDERSNLKRYASIPRKRTIPTILPKAPRHAIITGNVDRIKKFELSIHVVKKPTAKTANAIAHHAEKVNMA